MRRRIDLLSSDRVRLSRERSLQELREDLMRVAYVPGETSLASGVTSSGYFDKYLFTAQPGILRRLGRFLGQLVPQGTDRLAAPALGAVPLGAAVSLETGLPFAVVRGAHAARRPDVRAVEGGLFPGERVTLVEDVVVTATRLTQALDQLEAAGARPVDVVAVIDCLHSAAERLRDRGVSYHPLMTIAELGLPADAFGRSHRRQPTPGGDGGGAS